MGNILRKTGNMKGDLINQKASTQHTGLFNENNLIFVNLLGFEPRLAESKSDVLPLHHKSISNPFLNYDAKVQK
jgi:hypothetical protein